MIVVAVVVLALGIVPLAGGRLSRLAAVRFEMPGLLLASLGVQLGLATFPGPASWWRAALHVGSFVLGLAWLWLNRSVPGVWVVGVGAALNAIAIAANAGVMPASEGALRTAGFPTETENFANSGALEDPNLLFLGDVFAIPASWPFANVFSVGDVVIAVGAAFTIHAVCGSRLVPRGWHRVPEPSADTSAG
jgi:hypothetical protein